jgi:hypothetical protein
MEIPTQHTRNFIVAVISKAKRSPIFSIRIERIVGSTNTESYNHIRIHNSGEEETSYNSHLKQPEEGKEKTRG